MSEELGIYNVNGTLSKKHVKESVSNKIGIEKTQTLEEFMICLHEKKKHSDIHKVVVALFDLYSINVGSKNLIPNTVEALIKDYENHYSDEYYVWDITNNMKAFLL